MKAVAEFRMMPQPPSVKIERITPKRAVEYLDHNTKNRPLKDAVIRRYAKAMRDGHWRLTHQGIAFDTHGRVSDGQHRLWAIVKSGVTVEMMVSRGVSEDAFAVTDITATRTPSDFLALQGYKNATQLAATLHLQWHYEILNGDMATRLTPERLPDRDDIQFIADEHPVLVELAQRTETKASRKIISGSWVPFLRYQFLMRDKDDAEVFMHRLLTGSDLSEHSIILVTRNRLITMTEDKQKASHRNQPVDRAALIIKAWNDFRIGRECGGRKRSSWIKGKGEPFPKII